MKTHFRLSIAWALLLISTFSVFAAGAFSTSEQDSGSHIAALDKLYCTHIPGFHSSPSEFRISSSVIEAFDLEEETEADADETDSDDQNDLHYADIPSKQSLFTSAVSVPVVEELPLGFSTTFPTTRSLYLIFGVFRI